MVKLRRLTVARLKFGVLLTGSVLLVTTLVRQSGLAYHSSPLYRGINATIGDMGSGHFQTKRLCQAKTHIAYIKVEKTGSGTISSMLINFGRNRNLTFALSIAGNHYGLEPILPEHIAPIARGKHYDLLIQHSTFNHTTIKNIFPQDKIIFASIREPLSHFVSSFYFFQFHKLLPPHVQRSLNETKKMTTFIESGYQRLQSTPLGSRAGNIIFNRQSLRLGVLYNHSLDADFVRQYIDTVLNPSLYLVLIQEYFDESLILIKRKFCWNFFDILYMSYHVQNNPNKQFVYSSRTVNQHKELAVAEYIIYDHFYSKFWKTVLEEGAQFFEEVRAFKNVKNRINTFCVRTPGVHESLTIPSTKWSDKFVITGQKCLDMQVVIRNFVYYRRIEQMAELDRQYMKMNF